MYKVGVALTTLLAGTAFADLATTRIAPVAAWAESSQDTTDEGRVPSKAIDGSGLNESGGHDNAQNTGWMSAQNKYGWFVMDLGADRDIAAVKIWNFNWVNSKTHYEGRGVRQFDMFVAPSSLGFDGTRGHIAGI